MALGVCELIWLKILLNELHLHDGTPLILRCDSKATVDIVNNQIQHDRTKQIEIDQHFIKEKFNDGLLRLIHVRSGD